MNQYRGEALKKEDAKKIVDKISKYTLVEQVFWTDTGFISNTLMVEIYDERFVLLQSGSISQETLTNLFISAYFTT